MSFLGLICYYDDHDKGEIPLQALNLLSCLYLSLLQIWQQERVLYRRRDMPSSEILEVYIKQHNYGMRHCQFNLHIPFTLIVRCLA